MNKTTEKVLVIAQAKFCANLMDRLHESAEEWANAGCPDWYLDVAGLKVDGATKTQIKQDIVRLRRELNSLSRMVG